MPADPQSTQPANLSPTTQPAVHPYWTATLLKIARPVLAALSQRQLRAVLPIEIGANAIQAERAEFTYLEALGRTLTGIAPWLESKQQGQDEVDRAQLADLARQSIDAATDPASPDYMNFKHGSQPVVDAAFLAHGMLRAPRELWEKLDERVKKQLVAALIETRVIKPGESNWLWFSGMVEAALCFVGEPWLPERIDNAVKKHVAWYKGDGIYGDGANFHWDYYNSFVIQPMMLDALDTVSKRKTDWDAVRPLVLDHAKRYAVIQERLISPEGTIPPIGRSLAYRFGALQLLAMMTLRRELPHTLSPGQVRSAMTAVIRRMTEAPGTFDENGFLRIGFCGHQPGMGERYISTGSLYLCTAGLLPLGLPPEDEFWTCGPSEWTSQRAYSGKDIGTDHAIEN